MNKLHKDLLIAACVLGLTTFVIVGSEKYIKPPNEPAATEHIRPLDGYFGSEGADGERHWIWNDKNTPAIKAPLTVSSITVDKNNNSISMGEHATITTGVTMMSGGALITEIPAANYRMLENGIAVIVRVTDAEWAAITDAYPESEQWIGTLRIHGPTGYKRKDATP